MAHAYTPGLKVSPRTRYRCRRILPIKGEVLVRAGQQVDSRDVVAQTFMPGNITPVNVANLLSLPPADVPECMLKEPGMRVEAGEALARTKGIFGLFKSECRARVAGTIESISQVTGQVILRGEPIPVRVLAYLAGQVVEEIPGEGVVLEADATFIQGIFGIGGEAFGPVRMACRDEKEELTAERLEEGMKGAVVVGGSRMTGEAVLKAFRIGISALVSGGMDDADLREILGYDLGVAITGSEPVATTLIITEGFGRIAMARKTFQLLASREGDPASVNGATQIRAGVLRPEIVIPSAPGEAVEVDEARPVGRLELGTPVRVIRDPHFGLIGVVSGLPAEPQVLGSGSRARVLEVRSESGRRLVVPRANVELIEA